MNQVFLSDLISQMSIALDAVEADLLGATRYHSKRVSIFCLAMGRYLQYEDAQLFSLAGCALLHDNALTEYILSERFGSAQLNNLKLHSVIGEENCSFFPFPASIDGFIQYHHENADGSGPFHKKSGEYPQEAAIIALADQVDVKFRLQNTDVHKLNEIRTYIADQKGLKFDAIAVEAALAVLDETLLDSVKDDHIFGALNREMPEMVQDISRQQLIDLSGIIAKIIDYKSRFTQEHSTQIANKAWYMGGVYGYEPELRAQVYLAAALHDIGKLLIPTDILEKPDQLTKVEFDIIKSHVLHSWEILHPIRGFEKIALWASDHHEKLNGTGYPFGKSADDLDFNSRLMACLDIYQAVREKRPYHPSRNHEETMKILYNMANMGFIDERISGDLDAAFAALPGGYAPPPKMTAYPTINPAAK